MRNFASTVGSMSETRLVETRRVRTLPRLVKCGMYRRRRVLWSGKIWGKVRLRCVMIRSTYLSIVQEIPKPLLKLDSVQLSDTLPLLYASLRNPLYLALSIHHNP